MAMAQAQKKQAPAAPDYRKLMAAYKKSGERDGIMFPKDKVEKLGKFFDGQGNNAEGYASFILSSMHIYEARRKKGTLGSTIADFFKKNGITLPEEWLKPEDMKNYAAYDLMVLLRVIDMYTDGNGLGTPPQEIVDLMKDLAAGLQDGKSLLEQFPKLVVGLVGAIPKLALKVFTYGEMAVELPQIIGMLKDPSSSWLDMHFAVINGIEGSEEGYFP